MPIHPGALLPSEVELKDKGETTEILSDLLWRLIDEGRKSLRCLNPYGKLLGNIVDIYDECSTSAQCLLCDFNRRDANRNYAVFANTNVEVVHEQYFYGGNSKIYTVIVEPRSDERLDIMRGFVPHHEAFFVFATGELDEDSLKSIKDFIKTQC